MSSVKYETKACPRCAREFECKSGSILLCHCQTILITPEQLEYISNQYDDCLCHSCLLDLRTEYNKLTHAEIIKQLVGKR